MATLTVGFCTFPIPNFTFVFPVFSFSLPSLPDLSIDIDLECPLN
jgi:hypothetical protein